MQMTNSLRICPRVHISSSSSIRLVFSFKLVHYSSLSVTDSVTFNRHITIFGLSQNASQKNGGMGCLQSLQIFKECNALFCLNLKKKLKGGPNCMVISFYAAIKKSLIELKQVPILKDQSAFLYERLHIHPEFLLKYLNFAFFFCFKLYLYSIKTNKKRICKWQLEIF